MSATLALVVLAGLSSAAPQDSPYTAPADDRLHLRYKAFDPVTDRPAMPLELRARAAGRLFIVQFHGALTEAGRQSLRDAGAEVHTYLPERAYVVRATRDVAAAISGLPAVRWVEALHPAYRIDPALIAPTLDQGAEMPTRYNVLVVDYRQDAPGVERFIGAIGGTVDLAAGGGPLVVATLSRGQLLQVLHHDGVLWVDRWVPEEPDMDNARLQTGAEMLHGLAVPVDGKGINAHSYDTGFQINHPELRARAPYRQTPIVVGGNSGSVSHGTSVIGIIASEGRRARERGLLPFAQPLVTAFGTMARYQLARNLRDPLGPYKALTSTSSVSGGLTLSYNSVSSTTDRWIFDFDLLYTQSQSNQGSRFSRPEAWAKNTASVSGLQHFNNPDPLDDRFDQGSSRGPASDGRIGVTFCAYFSRINTITSGSGYTATFGGTSGATPMINGLCGLLINMFTDGEFGYPGVTWQNRFGAEPHFTTTKALGMATTQPMPIARGARVEQGWGLINVGDAYNDRDKMLVLDEEDVLSQGQSRTYFVFSPGGRNLRVAMTYADPPASAGATIHRINSLDLQVVAPDGTAYWGNNGLTASNDSAPGGVANDRDTEECVWLTTAQRGVYRVVVSAPAIRADGHVETAAVDADFALVVRGIGGGRDTSGMVLDVISSQPGQLDVALSNVPAAGWATGWTLFSANTQRLPSLGNFLGIEIDSLTLATIGLAPSAGNVFSFTNAGPSVYPYATFQFPAGLALALQGLTFDATTALLDGQGNVVAVSNVDRVTVQ